MTDNNLKDIRIIFDGRNTFVVNTEKDFHTHKGRIKKENFEKGFGPISTEIGKGYMMITPDNSDLFRIIRRKPQIILQKDLGYIIAICGINKESRIVEGGTGSGASAIFLSGIAKKVYSYETREEHLKFAKKNIEFFGRKNIVLRNKDIKDMSEKDIDVILLDVPEPWEIVESAIKSLRRGGHLVAYLPNITQIMNFVAEVKKHEELMYQFTKEISEQTWKIDNLIVRPVNHEFITHTAFLSFARRL